MKNKTIFFFAFLSTSLLFVYCHITSEPVLEQHFTLEEVKTIAEKYDLSNLVTMEKNGGLRYLTAEQLEAYFTDERRIRDYQKQDSLYEVGIKSIQSFADYERLIKTIPGMLERERANFEKSGLGMTYDEYLADMRNHNWHIYLEENKNGSSTLNWVRPEDDGGQAKGIRLDKKR